MGCENSKDFDALTSFSRLKPYRWSIAHFNRARKLMAKGQFIESPSFTRGSAIFFLKFYPNGAQGTAEGTTSLCLCLSKVLLPSLVRPTQYMEFEYCPKTRMAAAVAVPANLSPLYYYRAPLSQHSQLSQLSVPLAQPLPSAPTSFHSFSPVTQAQHLPQLPQLPQAQFPSSLSSSSSSSLSSASSSPASFPPSIRVRVCATLEFDNFSRFTVMPITQNLTPIKSSSNPSPSLGWSEYSSNYLPDQFVIEVDVQIFEDTVKTYVSAIPF